MRNLFLRYFQTPKHERHEVLCFTGINLGMEREEMKQLFSEEYSSIACQIAGCVPNTLLGPSQQPTYQSSFSQLCVKFVEAESHGAFHHQNSLLMTQSPKIQKERKT